MKLLWIKYKSKQSKNNYGLFLLIGTEQNHLVLLKTKTISTKDIGIIRRYADKLSELSLDRRINWLKHYCSKQTVDSIRTLKKSAITIISDHKINQK